MPIHKLKISNFKSIKSLDLDCRKINIFIGEPNTGKSNILEAIGLVSHLRYGDLSNFVRFENIIDLFYDHDIAKPISVEFDSEKLKIFYRKGLFEGELINPSNQAKVAELFSYSQQGGWSSKNYPNKMSAATVFKFYRFKKLSVFKAETSDDFLAPSDGKNLLQIILTNKDLRKIISELFKKFGYKIVLKQAEGKIEVQKETDDIIVSIPYALSSETLQRMTFYLAAIYSNKDSVIGFEEPEAHAFPYYMKYLAERIGLDSSNNQYFIATHNPYFLTSIMEKTPKNEIGTFVTYFEDYQTKVKALSGEEIESALSMGSDVFFNIDQFLQKESGKGN
jgi:hypothetical protein